MNVGLEYLALSRSSKSLSGGEAQRIRLATQIGSQLVGVLYILMNLVLVYTKETMIN
jgi:excinuclease ABC subunit A